LDYQLLFSFDFNIIATSDDPIGFIGCSIVGILFIDGRFFGIGTNNISGNVLSIVSIINF